MRTFFFGFISLCVVFTQGYADGFRNGTYAGEAVGYDGPVRVAVTVEKERISCVEVTKQNESRPRTALKEIPARIIRLQKTNVDAISGATVSSRAVMRAAQNALEQAK
jgi:uncharacterized protein with FMN-binding domain